MADIFLSYSREDHARAAVIAKALNAAGYEVFWDVEIPPGKSWADILEEKLGVCKAAVVLWSRVSTASKWVREEARLAHDRGKLIPVQIDEASPPFGFGEIQAADLKNWHGDTSDPHWRRFLNAVSSAVARPPASPPPVARSNPLAAMPRPPVARSNPLAAMPRPPSIGWLLEPASRGYLFAGIGVLALIAAIAFRYMPSDQPASPATDTAATETSSTTTDDGESTRGPTSEPAEESRGSLADVQAAPTAGSEVRSSGVTRQEIVRHLASLGHVAKLATDANTNEIVKTAVDGVSFNVYFYACKLERCGEIQFSAGWTMHTAPTRDALNTWNKQRRYTRAYTSEDGKGLFIEMDLNLADATSNEQIDKYLQLWKRLLGEFKKSFAL